MTIKTTKENPSNGKKIITLTPDPKTETDSTQTPKTRKRGYETPTQRTTPIYPILDGRYEFERPLNKRTSSDYGRKLTSDLTNQYTHHLQENGRILRDYLNRKYSTRPIQNIDFNISQGKLFIFSPYFPLKRLITDLTNEIDPKQFEENHRELILSIESPSST